MKTKRILIIIFLLFGFSSLSMAGDLSVGVKAGIFVASDEGVRGGKTLQVDLKYKDIIYAWGSTTQADRRIAGQRAGGINLLGMGIGTKAPITKNLNLYLQMGYYDPIHDAQSGGPDLAEAPDLYWKKWGRERAWDVREFNGYYKHKISGNFGGAGGVKIKHEIVKNLFGGMDMGYQFLKLPEHFWAFNNHIPGCYIETKNNQNFSGGLFNINIEFKF